MLKKNWKHFLISAFAVVYLAPLIFWNIYPLVAGRSNPRWLSSYLRFFGLQQGFQLFSPEPIGKNFKIIAEVDFQNGSTMQWNRQINKASDIEVLKNYRYRKLTDYFRPKRTGTILVPELADYLLTRYGFGQSKAGNAVGLRIYYFSSTIPEPQEISGRLILPEPVYQRYLLLSLSQDELVSRLSRLEPWKGNHD